MSALKPVDVAVEADKSVSALQTQTSPSESRILCNNPGDSR